VQPHVRGIIAFVAIGAIEPDTRSTEAVEELGEVLRGDLVRPPGDATILASIWETPELVAEQAELDRPELYEHRRRAYPVGIGARLAAVLEPLPLDLAARDLDVEALGTIEVLHGGDVMVDLACVTGGHRLFS